MVKMAEEEMKKHKNTSLFVVGQYGRSYFTNKKIMIDGEYGILAGHVPMVTCLTAGELRFQNEGAWRRAAISNGFIVVDPLGATVMADTAESPDEIDIHRANETKLRAEEALRQKQSIREYYHTQAALNRAMNRLKVAGRQSSEHA